MLSGATRFTGDLTKWPSDKQPPALAAKRASSRVSAGFGTKPNIEKQIQKIFADAARKKTSRVVTGSEPGCTIL